MLDLIEKIDLDIQLKNKVIDLAQKDRVKILSLAKKCAGGNFNCLRFKDDLTRLAVIIETAEYTLEKYRQLGIPEHIFIKTLDDIRIWCENNDNKGLANYNWIKNHLNCELFRIGRLQFQLFKCSNKLLDYSCFPFDCGENVINIHIPQGEKLIYSDCIASLKEAVVFFNKYFPDYNYRYFFCESWLLYGDNCFFMEPSSNIMQFSAMFDIVCSVDIDKQSIERIFGKRQLNKKKYQENTSLQRSAKAHLLNGGKLGMGIGIIDKYDMV